jgi:hypothetical protein
MVSKLDFYHLPALDLSDIDIETVVNYLTSQGWKPTTKHRRHHVLVFEGPLDDYGEPICLILPSYQSHIDAELRITEAIDLLANVEERRHGEILESLKDIQKRLSVSMIPSGKNAGI